MPRVNLSRDNPCRGSQCPANLKGLDKDTLKLRCKDILKLKCKDNPECSNNNLLANSKSACHLEFHPNNSSIFKPKIHNINNSSSNVEGMVKEFPSNIFLQGCLLLPSKAKANVNSSSISPLAS